MTKKDQAPRVEPSRATEVTGSTAKTATGLSRHTPGPWRHTGTGIDARAFDGSWKWLTPVVHGGTPAQATANRALIAAAPEMYEALKAMRDGAYGNPSYPQDNDRIDAAADAAIAKAEGR